MKQILAGYLVLSNGRMKMHGSIRGELADDTRSSREATCNWAREYVRTRFKLSHSDDIRIMALIEAPQQSAQEM